MLRWLTGSPRRSGHLTDDPLATIVPGHRPHQVYAVTRVNPIFVEKDDPRYKDQGAGVSGSSGYESQRSSCSEDTLEDTLENNPSPGHAPTPTPSHVKSILVAAVPALSTIPEGRIDYCIPRPIWPRYEGRQRKAPAVRVDGSRRRRAYKTMRRVEDRGEGKENVSYEGRYDTREKHYGRRSPRQGEKSPYDLLRELSQSINHAVDGGNEVPVEEILRDIGQKINKSLNAIASQNLSSERLVSENEKEPSKTSPEMSSSERALQRLSVNLGKSDALVTVGRALSHSSASGSDPELEAGRLSLLKRLGRFPPAEPLYDLAQGSTSSSSSGFSDLTPTPPSSASSRPFGPVFLHENPASVSNRVRNAMIYETIQCRTVGYEKLRAERRIELDKQWIICEKDNTDVAEKEICVFPRPDFTLDGQQAEILLRRLKASKRQRCWCRVITTTVGFVFFLFSVMVVSMMLTKGKRMFGSL